MKEPVIKNVILIGLALLMVAISLIAGGVAYFFEFSEGAILVILATLGFMYTITKPISETLENWVDKKRVLKVYPVYSKKEIDFTNDINSAIESLTGESCSVVSVDVLSTKRAVIQYYKK